jgi:hypothetical protein
MVLVLVPVRVHLKYFVPECLYVYSVLSIQELPGESGRVDVIVLPVDSLRVLDLLGIRYALDKNGPETVYKYHNPQFSHGTSQLYSYLQKRMY